MSRMHKSDEKLMETEQKREDDQKPQQKSLRINRHCPVTLYPLGLKPLLLKSKPF